DQSDLTSADAIVDAGLVVRCGSYGRSLLNSSSFPRWSVGAEPAIGIDRGRKRKKRMPSGTRNDVVGPPGGEGRNRRIPGAPSRWVAGWAGTGSVVAGRGGSPLASVVRSSVPAEAGAVRSGCRSARRPPPPGPPSTLPPDRPGAHP